MTLLPRNVDNDGPFIDPGRKCDCSIRSLSPSLSWWSAVICIPNAIQATPEPITSFFMNSQSMIIITATRCCQTWNMVRAISVKANHLSSMVGVKQAQPDTPSMYILLFTAAERATWLPLACPSFFVSVKCAFEYYSLPFIFPVRYIVIWYKLLAVASLDSTSTLAQYVYGSLWSEGNFLKTNTLAVTPRQFLVGWRDT